jgi:hypothetical protein
MAPTTNRKEPKLQIEAAELMHLKALMDLPIPNRGDPNLIELVTSNHVLRNGTLELDYEKPFGWLSNCGEKEGKWRLGESNP